MKILAILNSFNQTKTNRKTDMTSFGGNNNKFNPSFDGRSVGYHIENVKTYGTSGTMDVVIDDYHQVKAQNCSWSYTPTNYAQFYGAESAVKKHPDLPKNYRIETRTYYSYRENTNRIYFGDPGEKITDDIKENHDVVVHNFDRKRY